MIGTKLNICYGILDGSASSPKKNNLEIVLRRQDLNLRPSGYEPDELPDCSTPRSTLLMYHFFKSRSSAFLIKNLL